MLRGVRSVTFYHRPMEDADVRAAQSAREMGRRLGNEHHDVLVVLGSGLSGTAEALGAGEGPVPLDTLPYFPPTPREGTGPAPGRSRRRGAGSSSWADAAISTRA
jgi:hypothetical protein